MGLSPKKLRRVTVGCFEDWADNRRTEVGVVPPFLDEVGVITFFLAVGKGAVFFCVGVLLMLHWLELDLTFFALGASSSESRAHQSNMHIHMHTQTSTNTCAQ